MVDPYVSARALSVDCRLNLPFNSLVNKAASESTAIATVPGTFLVDAFPSLKHVPDWMPGAGFKRIAKEWRKLQHQVVHGLYDRVADKWVLVFSRLECPKK